MAEVVHRHHGGVLPHVVAGVAKLALLRELRVGAAGDHRTVEVERDAGLAGSHQSPAHLQLVIVEVGGFLIAVRVVIVRFHLGDQLVVLRATAGDVVQRAGAQVAVLDCGAHGLAVGGRGVAAAVLGILGEQVGVGLVVEAGAALQHLAVLVLGAVLQDRFPVDRVRTELVGQLDVLGRVEAEAVNAIGHGALEEFLHLVGRGLVLRADVPQAEQMALGHLPAVAIVDVVAVSAGAVGAGVEQVLVFPAGVDGVPVGDEVVGHHVDDDAHAVLVLLGGHFLEVILGADHEVAGAGGLVDVVPVLGELLAVGLVDLDVAHRLGLDGGVAGLGDGLHVLR